MRKGHGVFFLKSLLKFSYNRNSHYSPEYIDMTDSSCTEFTVFADDIVYFLSLTDDCKQQECYLKIIESIGELLDFNAAKKFLVEIECFDFKGLVELFNNKLATTNNIFTTGIGVVRVLY